MGMKVVPKVDAAAAEEKKVQERRRAADSAIAELNLQQNSIFPKKSTARTSVGRKEATSLPSM